MNKDGVSVQVNDYEHHAKTREGHSAEKDETIFRSASLDDSHQRIAHAQIVDKVQHSSSRALHGGTLLSEILQYAATVSDQVIDSPVRILGTRMKIQHPVHVNGSVFVRAECSVQELLEWNFHSNTELEQFI